MSEKLGHREYLERIYERLHPKDGISPSEDNIQLRLDKIVTLIYIQSLIADIQKSIEIAQDTININFDRDVDFKKWSNFHAWGLEYGYEDENLSRSLAIGLCTQDNSLNATYANIIAGYYPQIKDTTIEEDDNFRIAFRDALRLLSGSLLGCAYLNQAIRNAIKELCENLKALKESLDHEYSREAYISLYQKLYFGYNAAHANDIVDEYESHKRHREEINLDWLTECLVRELTSLYNSVFMKAMMEDLTYTESQKAAIPYPIDGLPKKDQEKFYTALHKLCSFHDGLFDFTQNDATAGRTIYNYRDTCKGNEYEAFLRFRLLATKISEDLKPLLNNCPTTPAKITKEKIQPSPNLCSMTFQANGITGGHVTLLYQKLMAIGWIPKDTPADDFQHLFSGKSCVCKITWTGGGKGNLRELFRIMREQQLITIPGNNGLESVLESHFVDKNGNYLTGLNSSGNGAKKSLPIINECIRILQQTIDFDE